MIDRSFGTVSSQRDHQHPEYQLRLPGHKLYDIVRTQTVSVVNDIGNANLILRERSCFIRPRDHIGKVMKRGKSSHDDEFLQAPKRRC